MSESQSQVEQEIEDTPVEHDPIGDFIDSIAAGDFNQSEKLFNSLLDDKVQCSLEAEKIAVADTVFNGAEPYVDVDEEDEDLLDDDED